jgi:glycosyltransferase involved in cell wall biosynthesis
MERIEVDINNYILFNKTEWNSKVFKNETNEIYEIHINSLENGLQLIEKFDLYCKENNVVYTSLRIVPTDTLIKEVLEASNYVNIENSLLVSNNLKSIKENKILERFKFTLRESTNNDIDFIKDISSNNFNHGRFFEDPKISKELAKSRNSNWIDDLKKKSNLFVGEIDGVVFAFMAFKIDETTNICNLELGGVNSKYSHLSYSFWYKIFQLLKDKNVTSVNALISSNNLPVVNLYSFFDFKFLNSYIGYRKLRKDTQCDILYVCGDIDYGDSVSGSYILYKILKKLDNVKIKVLPVFDFNKSKNKVDSNDFLPYIEPSQQNIPYLLNEIPKHKILIASGNDLPENLIKHICQTNNSKLVNITMTHWMYGNKSEYPELDGLFDGPFIDKRVELYNSVDSYIIVGSTHSLNVHLKSKLSNIPYELIPFPFDEIEMDDSPKVTNNRKTILWGTTQPETARKGKEYFENILDWLYKMCDNPNDILIKTIGPKSNIDTKFDVEYLGVIPNRKELSKVYKNVDVFALTTLADAGPMMATECIKNNTPLVSFPTNIASDFVEDGKNGYIVDGTEEYAKKLHDILYNKNYHMDMEYVKQFNSEETVVKKYNEFFKKLLK